MKKWFSRLFKKIMCKLYHDWASVWPNWGPVYICWRCGKIADDNDKGTDWFEISRSDIHFWKDFVPHALKKGILTQEEVSSLGTPDACFSCLDDYMKIINRKLGYI